MQERLQKFLARAGVASRRAAELLIASGDVLVNGQPVPLGTRVDPLVDKVTVQGREISLAQPHVYLMLHKPVGYLSTVSDDRSRPTVMDLLPTEDAVRLFPVGRLDLDTSGLLLCTNDGDFAYTVTHPKFKVRKKYHATVVGLVPEVALHRLQQGIELDDGMTAPAMVRVLDQSNNQTKLEFVIHEGRKRQVRRMCAAVGHVILELVRVQFGNLCLGELPVGETRQLSSNEVAELVGLAEDK